MHLLKSFLLANLLIAKSCTSLPFGSRSKKEAEDQEQQLAAQANDTLKQTPTQKEKVSVRGAASKVKSEKHSQSVATNDESPHGTIQTFFLSSPSDDDASRALKEEIENLANSTSMQHFLSTTRRALHRHPEVMYQEEFTSETIQDILTELDISFTTGWAKNIHQNIYPGPGGYGIVAHIGTQSEDQPCIILRADMDALPILESTLGIDEFKSLTNGKMHACGHDGHVTMLLGAAALLKNVETSIQGTIRLMFQPAEEGGAGGKRMVEEGVVDLSPPAQHAFGMHVWPTLPTGSIATRPGPLLAAAETFLIEIGGKGGHAAMPHLTRDPVVTASSLIMNLQTIVSRTLSPLESGVVSVTAISAGDAFNVIPATAVIKGTVRALSTEMLMDLRDKVEHITKSTAALYGCSSTISYSPDYYPPTVNDAELFKWSKDVGAIVSKEGYLRDIEPTMGGEDFAFLAEVIPSTFFLVGQGSGGDEKYHMPRTDYGLHHPSFALDEEVLPIGVELHANLALRSIKKLAGENEESIVA
jgi:IAA-amino acid hydrolase